MIQMHFLACTTLYSKFRSIMSTCLIMIIMRRIHKSWVIVNRITEIETAFSLKHVLPDLEIWFLIWHIPNSKMVYMSAAKSIMWCTSKYFRFTYIDISNRGMMLIKRYVDIQIPIKFGTVVHLANTSLGNIHCSLSFLFGKF